MLCGADYFFRFPLEGVCDRVLPAADFDAFEVRPSRSVFDAALAALLPVWRLGVPVCDRALPEEVFVVLLVLLLLIVFEAFDEALLPVVRLFAAIHASRSVNPATSSYIRSCRR